MKIEKLRFSNINSLAGDYEIDFTNPHLSEPGMFVITGPTGAGKTTIMDAICLALYGCSPRQKSIQLTYNELMTHGATQCMAEVYFEHNGKRYVNTARHARAHGANPFGRPQYRLREVMPDGTEREIATSGKALDEVERITGLTFENFKRCMMLAQGEFAAFLKSNAKERSAALTTITGTEIYLQIGKSVHDKIQALQTALDKLPVEETLSTEERAALEVEYKQALAAHVAAVQAVEYVHCCLKWMERKTAAAEQLCRVNEQKERVAADIAQFKKDGNDTKLELAARAMAVQGAWRVVERSRYRVLKVQESLPAKRAAAKQAQEAYESVSADVAAKRDVLQQRANAGLARNQEITEQLIPQERDLHALQQHASACAQAHGKAKTARESLQGRMKETEAALQAKKDLMADLEKRAGDAAGDAALGDLLPRVETHLQRWRQSAAPSLVLAPHEQLQQREATLRAQMADILGGLSLDAWTRRAYLLEQIQSLYAQCGKSQRALEEKKTELRRATETRTALPRAEELLQKAEVAEAYARQLYDLLGIEDKLSVLYEDFCAGKLSQCPCCGSVTPGQRHAVRNEEHVQAVQLAQQARAQADALIEQIRKADAAMVQARAQVEALELTVQQDANRLADALAECALDAVPTQLDECVEQNRHHRDRLQQLRTEVEQCEEMLRLSAIRQSFTEALRAYGCYHPASVKEASDIVSVLRGRWTAYTEVEAQLRDVHTQLGAVMAQRDALEGQVSSALEAENSAEREMLSIREKAAAATTQFAQRWGEKMSSALALQLCRAEQERIAKEQRAADRALSNALQQADAATLQLTDAEKNLCAEQAALAADEEQLADLLRQQNFATEQEYAEASVFIEQAESLRARMADLRLAEHRYAVQAENAQQALDACLRESPLKEGEDVEHLAASLPVKEAECRETETVKDAVHERVVADDLARRKNADRDREREPLVQQKALWEDLHAVLGKSSEGFMRYAQQITFESLIAHANKELRRLSTRYTLVRSSRDNGLGLDVVDAEFGNAHPRSCSNLSGGESFIISLALALGLSHMAADTRIDTLFLDEGFGTLDPATLDHVLAALNAMKSHGKTIGIISHVKELSEQIPAEIKVTPVEGGFSTLAKHPAVVARYRYPANV